MKQIRKFLDIGNDDRRNHDSCHNGCDKMRDFMTAMTVFRARFHLVASRLLYCFTSEKDRATHLEREKTSARAFRETATWGRGAG
jgi:hypothetical protein